MQAETQHLDLAKIRVGDEQEIERWYRVLQKPLHRFILTKVSIPSDAQEITQDTFLSCLESIPLFKGQSPLFTWMCGIAKHEIADYFRKKYAKRVITMIPFAEALVPTQRFDMHEVAHAVRSSLRKLSYKQRELLLLKYLDKTSVKGIATRLGMTAKSVEAALYRARKAFQEAYAE